MEKIKKYWLVLLLVFLIIVLLVLKLKYANQISNENISTIETNKNTPTKEMSLTENESEGETKTTTGTEEETERITPIVTTTRGSYSFTKPDGTKVYSNDAEADNLSDYVDVNSLEPLLPYKGNYFRVEKYLKEGYLEVIVKDDNNFNKAKEEVKNWLKDNNTDEEETKVIYIFE